jgi:hypothetical protein
MFVKVGGFWVWAVSGWWGLVTPRAAVSGAKWARVPEKVGQWGELDRALTQLRSSSHMFLCLAFFLRHLLVGFNGGC